MGAAWVPVREAVAANTPRASDSKVAAVSASWTQAAAAELARAGTLSATLRIPGAVGPVSVVADLWVAQIRTSVQVEAPSDGGGMRRVNWILRQLTDAPDSLALEVLFARREQTSCEQLKDARNNPGTKRNGLTKAFVPSVNDPVDAFYARVLQGLRPAIHGPLPPVNHGKSTAHPSKRPAVVVLAPAVCPRGVFHRGRAPLGTGFDRRYPSWSRRRVR